MNQNCVSYHSRHSPFFLIIHHHQLTHRSLIVHRDAFPERDLLEDLPRREVRPQDPQHGAVVREVPQDAARQRGLPLGLPRQNKYGGMVINGY